MPGSPSLVVDVAGEREPELGMVAGCARRAGSATRPEPTISVRWRSFGARWAAMRAAERRDPGDRGARERAEERARRGRARRPSSASSAEHRPRHREAGQHEPRRLADAARPRAQVLPRVQPAEERGDRPRDRDDDGQQRASATPDRCATDADERAADEAGEHVGDEQQAAEMLEALTRRRRSRVASSSQLQRFSVHGHQAASPTDSCSIGIPTSDLVCPEILHVNPSR